MCPLVPPAVGLRTVGDAGQKAAAPNCHRCLEMKEPGEGTMTPNTHLAKLSKEPPVHHLKRDRTKFSKSRLGSRACWGSMISFSEIL